MKMWRPDDGGVPGLLESTWNGRACFDGTERRPARPRACRRWRGRTAIALSGDAECGRLLNVDQVNCQRVDPADGYGVRASAARSCAACLVAHQLPPSVSSSFRRACCALLVLPLIAGCESKPAEPEPLTVFAGGSLERPLREALDSIAATGGPAARLRVMGSREIVRAVTSLERSPDLIVSADADVVERELIPRYVSSSTTFARNRIVLAFSQRSSFRDHVTVANWAEIAGSGRMRIARADPSRAPLGFRTALVWKLAEYELRRPGLAAKLSAASPDSLMRGNESELVPLLESGRADAAWCYESLARALRIRYVTLGDRIDLGSDSDSLLYMRAAVRVSGAEPGDSVVVAGAPIRYGMAIVTNGADNVGAAMLRERLLDAASKRIMRRAGLDVLDSVRVTTLGTKLGAAP
jgi:molybdate/tungstate transport system substrate-binding protein